MKSIEITKQDGDYKLQTSHGVSYQDAFELLLAGLALVTRATEATPEALDNLNQVLKSGLDEIIENLKEEK